MLSRRASGRGRFWKILRITFLALIGVAIIGVLFIKFDTAGAAQFTDTVLRPVLGANRVIALEKVFFNLSDKAKQLTVNQNNLSGPQFIDQGGIVTGGSSGSRLELDKIPLTNNFKPLKNEGIWLDRPLSAFPSQNVMAVTFTRPDTARSYAIVTVAQIDTSKIAMGIVAGTKEPGGAVGKPGPGVVPKDIVDSGKLVAAFDGGFQYRDGQYGMIVGNTTYLPLQTNLGTIIGYKDGTLKIVDYIGQPLGNNVAFVRQNCPILIDAGHLAVSDQKNKALWGRTPTTDIYTWRSGIGLNKNGDLLFAVGNNLTPTTLALALQAAGAVNAIQLDINPSWVRFNIFESVGGGQYTTSTLTRDLKDGSTSYLHGYSKDFFYLYLRSKIS